LESQVGIRLICNCNHYNVFLSKTNQMHNISNLFYFETILYMFLRVSPFIIRSLRLYIYLMLYYSLRLLMMDGETVRNRVLFQNKRNLKYCASGWFRQKIYYDALPYKLQIHYTVFYFIILFYFTGIARRTLPLHVKTTKILMGRASYMAHNF
jgi:hypothetical protein